MSVHDNSEINNIPYELNNELFLRYLYLIFLKNKRSKINYIPKNTELKNQFTEFFRNNLDKLKAQKNIFDNLGLSLNQLKIVDNYDKDQLPILWAVCAYSSYHFLGNIQAQPFGNQFQSFGTSNPTEISYQFFIINNSEFTTSLYDSYYLPPFLSIKHELKQVIKDFFMSMLIENQELYNSFIYFLSLTFKTYDRHRKLFNKINKLDEESLEWLSDYLYKKGLFMTIYGLDERDNIKFSILTRPDQSFNFHEKLYATISTKLQTSYSKKRLNITISNEAYNRLKEKAGERKCSEAIENLIIKYL